MSIYSLNLYFPFPCHDTGSIISACNKFDIGLDAPRAFQLQGIHNCTSSEYFYRPAKFFKKYIDIGKCRAEKSIAFPATVCVISTFGGFNVHFSNFNIHFSGFNVHFSVSNVTFYHPKVHLCAGYDCGAHFFSFKSRFLKNTSRYSVVS